MRKPKIRIAIPITDIDDGSIIGAGVVGCVIDGAIIRGALGVVPETF